MTFWFHGLAVPGVSSTPVAPKASAVRRMVPTLPGSCNPARTINREFFASSRCSKDHCGACTSAAIPCGDSVTQAWLNASGATRYRRGAGREEVALDPRSSVWLLSNAWVVWPSRTNTLWRVRWLRTASSRRCGPSMATSPSFPRPARKKRLCRSFKRLFWRLSMTSVNVAGGSWGIHRDFTLPGGEASPPRLNRVDFATLRCASPGIMGQ